MEGVEITRAEEATHLQDSSVTEGNVIIIESIVPRMLWAEWGVGGCSQHGSL